MTDKPNRTLTDDDVPNARPQLSRAFSYVVLPSVVRCLEMTVTRDRAPSNGVM